MPEYLGVDTSNYTTSLAVFDSESFTVFNERKLLPVAPGELGLRQSDALFHHTKQLPELFERLSARTDLSDVSGVAVSDRPRSAEGSYMPCFLAGVSAAQAFAAAKGLSVKRFSHQQGHIAAVLYSADRLDLSERRFLAFHLSGGTTEAVLVTPGGGRAFETAVTAESLDLKAGQAIDRVGVALGLDFPAGAQLDSLAAECDRSFKIKPFFRGSDCSLSGVENKCRSMISAGEDRCVVAKYCLSYISAAVVGMAERLIKVYGEIPLVFSGGVSENSLLRAEVSSRFDAVFGAPGLSADNAAGIAVLAAM